MSEPRHLNLRRSVLVGVAMSLLVSCSGADPDVGSTLRISSTSEGSVPEGSHHGGPQVLPPPIQAGVQSETQALRDIGNDNQEIIARNDVILNIEEITFFRGFGGLHANQGCRGYSSDTPPAMFQFRDNLGVNTIRIELHTEYYDSALLVQSPDGELYCSLSGTVDEIPVVLFRRPDPGVYTIWAGLRFAVQEPIPAVLTILELRLDYHEPISGTPSDSIDLPNFRSSNLQ